MLPWRSLLSRSIRRTVLLGVAATGGLAITACGKSERGTASPGNLDAGGQSDASSGGPGPASQPGTDGETPLPSKFDWTSTGPLISAVPDAQHSIVSVKDPSVVFFDGRWHVFATTADSAGQWSLVYLNFEDWSQAAQAPLYYLDQNPALTGYHAAPQVFYFAPQDQWYLIFQSGQPQYSTTDDLRKPETWSAPKDFFASEPDIVKQNAGTGDWLDFWVICDDADCHLFFADDNGHYYRSDTSVEAFPEGFSDPVIAIDGTKTTVFEGGATYRVGKSGGYLTMIEAFGNAGERYYRSFLSDTLDGAWAPLAASPENPFAGRANVTFEDAEGWTNDISHGELLRDGYDQTPTIDPANLRFLYQGVDPARTSGEYFERPYQLGLLTYTSTPTSAPADGSGPSVCEGATAEASASVADFEDGSTSGWWDSYDETPSATHAPLAPEAPGAQGTALALHFSGTGYAGWGANFGNTPGCMDTSSFTGLSFYARGTSGAANELNVIAQVPEALPLSAGGDCVEDCYSHPRTTITLTDEWTRYDLPFSQFQYPGWGVETAYQGTLMGFAFESAGPDFDVWVDELMLFTGAGAAPDAGPPSEASDAGKPADGGVRVDAGPGPGARDGGATRDAAAVDASAM
jgi:endo-1,4-beta-xylanase